MRMFGGRRGGGMSCASVLGLLALAAATTAVLAQDVPKAPDFVPYVIQEQEHAALQQHLRGLKYGDAEPVMNFLAGKLAAARAQWVADHTPKLDSPAVAPPPDPKAKGKGK